MKKVSVALAFAALTAFAQPSFAQTLTPQALAAQCAGGADCVALVQNYIAARQAAGRPVTAGFIANLTVALGNVVTPGMPAATRSSIASAVNVAAAASPDAGQQVAIQQIAQTIQTSPTVSTASVGDGGSAE